MNSLSHLYGAAQLGERLDQSAAERLAPARPDNQRRERLTAAAKSVWLLLGGPADRPLQLPVMSGHPYRG